MLKETTIFSRQTISERDFYGIQTHYPTAGTESSKAYPRYREITSCEDLSGHGVLWPIAAGQQMGPVGMRIWRTGTWIGTTAAYQGIHDRVIHNLDKDARGDGNEINQQANSQLQHSYHGVFSQQNQGSFHGRLGEQDPDGIRPHQAAQGAGRRYLPLMREITR